MTTFSNNSARLLAAAALVLGAGVYYHGVSEHRVEQARTALRGLETAQMELETARDRAERYNLLLAEMASQNKDRQEPFAVVSEFSPQEIKQVGQLLGTLYQRDGHFFLEHFEISWRNGNARQGILPRVALELEGRKVLLFSDQLGGLPAVAAAGHGELP
jgi:hypothetical protein